MDVAKSICTRAFTLMRDAKNMDDMKRLSDSLDAPEWVSIDRFGRQLLNRKKSKRESSPSSHCLLNNAPPRLTSSGPNTTKRASL